MGGNALKHTGTRRYQADEYYKLVNIVIDHLTGAFPHRVEVIPAYASKSSFGDMDILHNIPNLSITDIRKIFNPTEVIKNGSVISFDYQKFQIDLIYSSEDEFDYALSYFSYNDAGNLVGRIAHKLGLRHGHNGLWMPIRDGDYLIDNIPVTKVYQETLSFLGLPAWKTAPKNLEDIFQWVASSCYFNPDIYLFDNLNAVSRIRDRKRETYRSFLEWCRTQYNGPRFEFKQDKTIYHSAIFSKWPHVELIYHSAWKRRKVQIEIKEKFNGNIVGELTGLESKKLGEFMAIFRNRYQDRLEFLSADEIKMLILEQFKDE